MNLILKRTKLITFWGFLFFVVIGCGNKELQNEISRLKEDKESLEQQLALVSKERDSLKVILLEQEKIKKKNIKANLVLLNKSNEQISGGNYIVEATIKNIGKVDAQNIEVYFTNAKSLSKLEELRKEFRKLIDEHNSKYPDETFNDYEINSLLNSKHSYLYHYAFVNYIPAGETIKIRTSEIPQSTLAEEITISTKSDDGLSSKIRIRYLAKMIGFCGNKFFWKYK